MKQRLPSIILHSITGFVFTISIVHAEMREWRSADGSKTFRGELVKQAGDSVTIRNDAGKELTFPTAKLHADDVKWLAAQSRKVPVEPGVFGGIRFGETEAQLLERLKTNPHVTVPSGKTSAFGTSEPLLNVKTKAKPGGSAASVSFSWSVIDNAKGLHGIDITCEPQVLKDYRGRLRKSHDELAALFIAIHGKPATTAPYPAAESLKTSELSPTHRWEFADGSSLEVGVGLNQAEEYLALGRFMPPVVTAPRVEK